MKPQTLIIVILALLPGLRAARARAGGPACPDPALSNTSKILTGQKLLLEGSTKPGIIRIQEDKVADLKKVAAKAGIEKWSSYAGNLSVDGLEIYSGYDFTQWKWAAELYANVSRLKKGAIWVPRIMMEMRGGFGALFDSMSFGSVAGTDFKEDLNKLPGQIGVETDPGQLVTEVSAELQAYRETEQELNTDLAVESTDPKLNRSNNPLSSRGILHWGALDAKYVALQFGEAQAELELLKSKDLFVQTAQAEVAAACAKAAQAPSTADGTDPSVSDSQVGHGGEAPPLIPDSPVPAPTSPQVVPPTNSGASGAH